MKTPQINFFLQFLLFIFLFPVASFADVSSPGEKNISSSSRDHLIQEKLDCVTSAVKLTDESQWEQLCSTSGTAATRGKREDIITRALDSTEKKQTSQPDAEATPPPAYGQKRVQNEAGEDLGVIQLKEHDVEFGTELYRYSYKEPGFNLEIKGLQFGVEGAYVYRPGEGDALRSDVLNMYKFDARFAFGPVDYHSDPSGQLKDEDNYAFETRGVAGYDHFLTNNFF
ncbi:MAG: hypothetical protein HZA28_02490 [Candidatus Omnitrophica bacterium]|nr:hypothetical protein [Candidatus Omnitrophota bacterium]